MDSGRPTITIAGGGELLERAAEIELLHDRLAAVRASGRGRLVLVAGEAGIGKTALVRAFCDGARTARVLWGASDALFTPRALGPLLDIALAAGGELGALAAEGAAPGALVAALTRELRQERAAIVVLEDLHWADGRRWTSSGCSRAGSRPCLRSSSPPTATTSSTASARCGCSASCGPGGRRTA